MIWLYPCAFTHRRVLLQSLLTSGGGADHFDDKHDTWGFLVAQQSSSALFLTGSVCFCVRAMHNQLLALRKLVQLLDPPMHAFMEAKSCLNYFFCYRWLLIHFKREFTFDEVRCNGSVHCSCILIWA